MPANPTLKDFSPALLRKAKIQAFAQALPAGSVTTSTDDVTRPFPDKITGVSVRIPLVLRNPLNNRQHWRKVRDRSHREKEVVWAHLLKFGQPSVRPPCVVTLTRVYTGHAKEMDAGCGLNASFKAVRDSVATWLGTDDSPRSGIEWKYTQERGDENAVVVTVEPAQENQS